MMTSSSSSSSSSILLIQIPTPPMDSHVTQTLLLKPQNLNFPTNRNRHIQYQLNNHHRLRVLPLRCSATPSSSSGGDHRNDDDAIVLHVRGMMCEGCASSVKKILESQPQVLSATVNLKSETALVSPLLSSEEEEEKTTPNWQKKLGETLAQHLTSCGFTSTLTGQD